VAEEIGANSSLLRYRPPGRSQDGVGSVGAILIGFGLWRFGARTESETIPICAAADNNTAAQA